LRQAARQRKEEKFTALFHHLTIDLLEHALDELKEDAAAGVDGLTGRSTTQTSSITSRNCMRVSIGGAYRALPSRRVYIPKPDGRQRPLVVAALEDKIVQRATVAMLNAIYEELNSRTGSGQDAARTTRLTWLILNRGRLSFA
jgi:RNA-directed DNA polymerase